MRTAIRLAAACLCVLPGLVGAADRGYLDLYYVPKTDQEFTVPSGIGSGSADGQGFGVKGWAPLSDSLGFTGEYQTSTYSDSDAAVGQVRFGLGMTGETRSGLYLEYVDADFEGSKADGFAAHGRIEGGEQASNMYAQVGYLKLKDDTESLKGLEYLLGIAFPFNASSGAFVDYRKTRLKGEDSGNESIFTDIRAGIRINF